MSYTTSPYVARARRDAVDLVLRHGFSPAEAARKTGVHRSTISRWIKKAEGLELHWREHIPTLSSASHTHANCLSLDVVDAIVRVRKEHNRCAVIVHQQLIDEGVSVSLSSVKRTLKREGLIRPVSKWKRYRPPVPRPQASEPGELVQIDTVHFIDWKTKDRFYAYTMIDLYSRWAYVELHPKLRQDMSFRVVMRAQAVAPFRFKMIQSDNGPEFQRWFKDNLEYKQINLRHSRVRRSNDNAHIERFNRTLQEEGIGRHTTLLLAQEQLTPFLRYYNNDRMHLGINCLTPAQMLQRR
ncbi:DDE-type integrase/transposase/recombinase [Candidatus Saccharibacteria bacterium]|jgi:transposase InsO family protein|nr:DDE-type integrase/transposase/recombinase [Candidatus Saccharibacteria bacterium]